MANTQVEVKFTPAQVAAVVRVLDDILGGTVAELQTALEIRTAREAEEVYERLEAANKRLKNALS